MNPPKVSIITATYNAAETIESAIFSVESQSYSNIEHIIIDGNSSDCTKEIVNEFRSPNRLYIRERDTGIYDAMNKGISNSSGDYILILNADDRFYPGAVEKLVHKALSIPVENKIVSSLAQFTRKHNRLNITKLVHIGDHVRLRMPLRHGTMLVPRRIYERFGLYDTKLDISADHEFTIRCYNSGVLFPIINEPLLLFDRGGVSGAVSHRLVDNRLLILKKYFPSDSLSILEQLTKNINIKMVDSLLKNNISTGLRSSLISYSLDILNWEAKGKKSFFFHSIPQPPKELLASSFRIATICSTTKGGAGQGSLRRVRLLRSAGIRNEIITMDNNSNELDYIVSLRSEENFHSAWGAYYKAAIQPLRLAKNFKASELFALNYCAIPAEELNTILSRYDILHFHWTNAMIDYGNFLQYDWLNKPIIWTFADMHHFTGGCHYSEGCSKFKSSCTPCHLVDDYFHQMVSKSHKQKKVFFNSLHNLTIVYPSQWLKSIGESSGFFSRQTRHEFIANPFPLDEFKPDLSAKITKKRLGNIPNNTMCLLAGAETISNKRKGFDLLVRALQIVKARSPEVKIHLSTFGNPVNIKCGYAVNNFGTVSDKKILSSIYSSSDFFVFPSREDNAPLTVSESLACGTPVISSGVGNTKDLVSDDKTGYLFECGSAESLASIIEKAYHSLCTWRESRVDSTLTCRRAVSSYNSPRRSVQSHIKIYKESLNRSMSS